MGHNSKFTGLPYKDNFWKQTTTGYEQVSGYATLEASYIGLVLQLA